jgi:hypothetical protein
MDARRGGAVAGFGVRVKRIHRRGAENAEEEEKKQPETLAGGRKKERGARRIHKRLLYCVNVNRTSLDHLLLG